MGAFDPKDLPEIGAEEIAERVEAIQLQALRNAMTREAAIERGRAYGTQTADERGETGADRDQRVRRAMAYAAWEYDGKPLGGAHLREFDVTPSAQLQTKPSWHTDFKKGK